MYLLPRINDENSKPCPPGRSTCGPGIVESDRTPGSTQDETDQAQVPDNPPQQNQQAVTGQQFGRRTFAGIVILAIVIMLGVVIYGIFGKWPRRKLRKWKKQRRAKKHAPRRMKSQGVQTDKEEKRPLDCELGVVEHTDSETISFLEESPRISMVLDGSPPPPWSENVESTCSASAAQPTQRDDGESETLTSRRECDTRLSVQST